jgi:hypothetical protein
MFAHDLCHSQIEYLCNSTRREPLGRTIDLNRKDRAKRYHKSSIVNRQSSIPALPGWAFANDINPIEYSLSGFVFNYF